MDNSIKALESVPNVSEGRRPDVLMALQSAVSTVEGAHLVDMHRDIDHNRAVFTLMGSAEAVVQADLQLAKAAVEQIDLRQHEGVHPRIGAVDVVPLVPLPPTSQSTAIQWAHELGEQIWEQLRVPVYLYGQAARRPSHRRLAFLRRGGFAALAQAMRDDPERRPDIGDPVPHPTAGATAIGVRPPLIAFNVALETDRLEIAQAIARQIRQVNGGLPGVQALGFRLASRGKVQVSVNLLRPDRTPLHQVVEAIRRAAAQWGVQVGPSELVGLIPLPAVLAAAAGALGLPQLRPEQVLEWQWTRCQRG